MYLWTDIQRGWTDEMMVDKLIDESMEEMDGERE